MGDSMTESIKEILARKEARRREEEEDNRKIAESYKEAAAEIKGNLQDLADLVKKDILDLLDLDVEKVKEWLRKQNPSKFDSEEQKAAWDAFRRKHIGKSFTVTGSSGENETITISKTGAVKQILVDAWKANPDIKPIKSE